MSLGVRQVHINGPLSDFALMFMQTQEGFIADKVCPQVQVKKLNDSYFTFDRGNWRTRNDFRGPTGDPNRAVLPKPSTASYNIQEHSQYDLVSWEEIDEADEPLQPKQDTVNFLMENILVGKEQVVANLLFATAATGSYTSLATAAQWSYTSSTTPLQDIDLGIDTVQLNIGKNPNTGICGRQVYTKLKRHGQILDLIRYVQQGKLTTDLMASLLDLDNLYVGQSVYMSSTEGATSENVQYLWGKHFMVSYVNPNRPNKKVLSHAYQFTKPGNGSVLVREWQDDPRKSTAVEAATYYDARVTCSLCAYIIFGAVV